MHAPQRRGPSWGKYAIGAVILSAVGGIGALVVGVALVFGASHLIFGELLREVPLSTEPTEVDLGIKGRPRLQLSLYVSEIDAPVACKRLAVEVELRNGGHTFQSYDGHGWSLTKGSERHASDSTMTLDTVDLPSSRLDELRAWYRFEPEGCGGSVDGLVLQLREPRF